MFLTSCPDTEERLRKEFDAYLDVHIAVRVEGAVDHMQGDIDVRYLVQQINYHRLLHFSPRRFTLFTTENFFSLSPYATTRAMEEKCFFLPFSDLLLANFEILISALYGTHLRNRLCSIEATVNKQISPHF